MHGFDTYDYGTRGYYSAIGRFTTIDPLAEKDYSISPYAYCENNPANRIDPEVVHCPENSPKGTFQNISTKLWLVSFFGNDQRRSEYIENENASIGTTNKSIIKGQNKDWRAITPGLFLVYPKGGTKNKFSNTHEPGHVIQFLILGPAAYYTLVAIPSLITSTTKYHNDMPWETAANQLWYWLTGENDTRHPLPFEPNKK